MEEKKNKRVTGSRYEQLACDHLVKKGYRILERNFHFGRSGEIDIIALSPEGMLTIVECKYRSKGSCGSPLEAVDPRKQHMICHTTLGYYMKHGLGPEHPCRFDVIAFEGSENLTHIENAFEFC